MNKEIYERAGLVITEFDVEDVIITSAAISDDENPIPGDNEGSII